MLSACRRFGSSKPNPAVIPGREQGEPGGLGLVNIIDNIIDRHTRAGGYPVRRRFSAPSQALWNTGSSAFADDDGCKRGSHRTHSMMTTGKYYPSPSSLASNPFTARAHPASFRSRVAWLMAGLKRCSRRQLSTNLAGSG